MGQQEYRRKQILVDGKLQMGLSLQIIGYVYLYLVIFALLANFNALRLLVFGDGSDPGYVDAVSRLQIFVQTFVVPLVFTFICISLHGMLFSHRIAGPIYRFKQTLRSIKSGNLPKKISIRERDYFGDLCDEMNGMLGQLRGDLLQFRNASQELAREGEELAKTGNLPEDAQKKLVGIANASTRLRQLVDGYHLEDLDAPAPGAPDAVKPEPEASLR